MRTQKLQFITLSTAILLCCTHQKSTKIHKGYFVHLYFTTKW